MSGTTAAYDQMQQVRKEDRKRLGFHGGISQCPTCGFFACRCEARRNRA